MSSRYLQVAVTQEWFNKIWTGQKRIEYKEATEYWQKKLDNWQQRYKYIKIFYGFDKMNILVFEIKNITVVDGTNTDLKINSNVFAIELGKPMYFILGGNYNFFDVNIHKQFKIKYGIATGYRRRPQKLLYGKPINTEYTDDQMYGYNGDEDLEKYKKEFKNYYAGKRAE